MGRALTMLRIIRYADDFVVMHESRDIIDKAKKYIENWLKNIGLQLNVEKTRIVHTLRTIDKTQPGFDFLGFKVRQFYVKNKKSGYVTIIKPNFESQKRHRKKIRHIIDKLSSATQKQIIEALNPEVRGWANYYKAQVARKAFEKMDDYMWWRLWKWARLKHPNKGAKWIKRKYFRYYEGNSWRFMTHQNDLLNLHRDISYKKTRKSQGNEISV